MKQNSLSSVIPRLEPWHSENIKVPKNGTWALQPTCIWCKPTTNYTDPNIWGKPTMKYSDPDICVAPQMSGLEYCQYIGKISKCKRMVPGPFKQHAFSVSWLQSILIPTFGASWLWSLPILTFVLHHKCLDQNTWHTPNVGIRIYELNVSIWILQTEMYQMSALEYLIVGIHQMLASEYMNQMSASEYLIISIHQMSALEYFKLKCAKCQH